MSIIMEDSVTLIEGTKDVGVVSVESKGIQGTLGKGNSLGDATQVPVSQPVPLRPDLSFCRKHPFTTTFFGLFSAMAQ